MRRYTESEPNHLLVKGAQDLWRPERGESQVSPPLRCEWRLKMELSERSENKLAAEDNDSTHYEQRVFHTT